jgi:hypothetical protein
VTRGGKPAILLDGISLTVRSMDINAKTTQSGKPRPPVRLSPVAQDGWALATRPVLPPPLSENRYVESLIAIHKGQGTLIKASDIPTESPTKFAEFAYGTHRV